MQLSAHLIFDGQCEAAFHFYERVLGFKAVRCDIIKVQGGGRIRHIFFDTGRDQLLAFMEARDVPGIPEDYDAGIVRGLGVPSAFYHFAFEAGSEAALVEKRNELIAKGVDVTDVVDHDWAKSIYFKDPNGLQFPHATLTTDQVAALGLKGFEGGFFGTPLKGSDGKPYILAVRPILPDDPDN